MVDRNARADFHNVEARLRDEERLIEHSKLGDDNKRALFEFKRYLLSSGITLFRVVWYLTKLRKLGLILGKDFEHADRKDIEDLVLKVETNRNSSAWTKHDYKVALKKFYQWLRDSDNEYPSEVRWIKTTIKDSEEFLPENLLSEDEVMAIIRASASPRDRAFLMLLYESGGRIAEVGTLKIGDIAFKERWAEVVLKGKTGSRRTIAIASMPYLQTWIEHHPDKERSEAPLWISGHGKKMTYSALRKILKEAARRAGIKKPIHPHLLRHSRATYLANRLTEAQMNEVFGWKQGSEMASVYVHLSGRDVDGALLGIFGLKAKEGEAEPKIKPAICPRCAEMNAPDAQICKKCGLVLDVALAARSREEQQTYSERLDRLEKLIQAILENGIVDRISVGIDVDKRFEEFKKKQGWEPRNKMLSEMRIVEEKEM